MITIKSSFESTERTFQSSERPFHSFECLFKSLERKKIIGIQALFLRDVSGNRSHGFCKNMGILLCPVCRRT